MTGTIHIGVKRQDQSDIRGCAAHGGDVPQIQWKRAGNIAKPSDFDVWFSFGCYEENSQSRWHRCYSTMFETGPFGKAWGQLTGYAIGRQRRPAPKSDRRCSWQRGFQESATCVAGCR